MSEVVKTAHREAGTVRVKQNGALVREEKATKQKRQVKVSNCVGLFDLELAAMYL